MSCTTTSVELNVNQVQIRDTDVNGLSVRGGNDYICWSQLDIKTV